MINIVIPMAGAGSRFKVAGYRLPKPFIDVNGKMMIERVLDCVQISDATYTLIIQKQFKVDYIEKLEHISKNYCVNFITVEGLTQGACCTALASHPIINNERPVIFVDSDNFFSNQIFKKFIEDSKKRKLDGSLLTFNTNEECFSFAQTNSLGYVVKTAEKEAISNHAIAGVYLFSKGSNFVSCAIETIIYGDKSKNEYYMSNVYNWAIKHCLKIGIFDIEKTDWFCVGTPQHLIEYIKTVKNI